MHLHAAFLLFSRNMECFLRTPSLFRRGSANRAATSDASGGRKPVARHHSAKCTADGTDAKSLLPLCVSRLVDGGIQPVLNTVTLGGASGLSEALEQLLHTTAVQPTFRHADELARVTHCHREERTHFGGLQLELKPQREHVHLDRLDGKVDRVHGRCHAVVDGVLSSDDQLLCRHVRLTEQLCEHCFRVFHYSRFLSSKYKKHPVFIENDAILMNTRQYCAL